MSLSAALNVAKYSGEKDVDSGKSVQFSSPVDFNTLPVDCPNFPTLTAAMLSCVCRGTKKMRALGEKFMAVAKKIHCDSGHTC